MKRYRFAISLIVFVFIFLFVFVTFVNRRVTWTATQTDVYSYKNAADVDEKYDCILVFGAGIISNSRPSHMLEDRLKGAIALYNAGVSDTILLSGDHSGDDYDEVSVMQNFCLDAGIPANAIVRDDNGFSTYESVQNAAHLGYKKVILVTQEYHLYRALYIADELELEADGLTANYRTYFMQIKRDIREYAARVKDFFLMLSVDM